MQPRTLTLGPLAAADGDGICESQTPAAGGEQDLTIDGNLASGGVATLDVPRRVAITSGGNDAARTFTVTGTNRYGRTITESITGPNTTTVYSLLDFATVTQVTVDDDTAGAITVGTNAIASTAWFPLDHFRNPFNVALSVYIDGTGTYTVEFTSDNLQTNADGPWDLAAHSTLDNLTADAQGNLAFPVYGVRLVTDAYTSGEARLVIQQAGLRGG